jgi:hypothetical protein
VPVDREQEVETLYRTRYSSFTARHFHDHLVRDNRFTRNTPGRRAFLQSRGLLTERPAAARTGANGHGDHCQA